AVQVRKLHPAPAHAGRHRSVTDRLTQRLGHAVADAELALLELRQHERTAHTRLHRMEVAELAPADLVHPHPLPRGAHEHDLLGDVLERAHPLARLLETLRRAWREISDGGVRLGAFAWAVVQVGGPVALRLMVDGDHSSPIVTSSSRRRASRRASERSRSPTTARSAAVGTASAPSTTL